MKRSFGAAAAVVAAAGLTWAAVSSQAVNSTCPLKQGQSVKPNITSTYKGKTVAFCCNNCKGQFDANPEKFVANIPELAGPQPPTSLGSVDEALKAGRLAVIAFLDYSQRSDLFEKKVLADPLLADAFSKVAYVKVNFKKDSEDAKKWKVTSAPTLLLVDAAHGEPRELKRLAGGSPVSIKKEIETALKKVEAGDGK
jgi:YHS domain-containing protein